MSSRETLRFKKLNEQAVLPDYSRTGDAGFNLYSLENYVLPKGERHVFQVGLASEIPKGYCVIIKPRSGLAVKAGIDVLAGVIDEGYRGEWGVVLINFGNEEYEIKLGDKIAQGVMLKIDPVTIVEVDTLTESDRGTGAFGSTGK